MYTGYYEVHVRKNKRRHCLFSFHPWRHPELIPYFQAMEDIRLKELSLMCGRLNGDWSKVRDSEEKESEEKEKENGI
jgi:hypothetical protein